LPKIVDERGTVPALDDDVVDVDLDVLADLILEASLHALLVSCVCFFKPKVITL
jgi:hypothetical protein